MYPRPEPSITRLWLGDLMNNIHTLTNIVSWKAHHTYPTYRNLREITTMTILNFAYLGYYCYLHYYLQCKYQTWRV